ncbi:sigma-70 family RNA polymerase sigma factor [Aeromicrobium sp. NPDC092404]|uniref:RNA polymerase sigma factor n=1 Tax=Aeromicrobium sp. NPDC092404 TaxID=3154976 RepID=UPI00342C7BD1
MDDDRSTTLTDAELVLLTRRGHLQAYAVLFERHLPLVRAAARRFVRASEVDDLVAEAFAGTFHQLVRGRGPTTSIRAYLLTAMRHEAARRAGRDRRLVLVDDVETWRRPSVDTAGGTDEDHVAEAFRLLPLRWQRVLWQLEVEGLRPRDLADELGMSANAVSALGRRARAGLRRAYEGRTDHLDAAV